MGLRIDVNAGQLKSDGTVEKIERISKKARYCAFMRGPVSLDWFDKINDCFPATRLGLELWRWHGIHGGRPFRINLSRIPEGARYYVTIDIDAFCPSIAPGTGTPSHGGFLYYDVLEILQGLSKRGHVVGMDLVEVAPAYDQSESTQILAAQLLLNFIGFVFHARKEKAGG